MRRLPIVLAMAAAPAWAQPPALQQARVTGGDPVRGKCTAEVTVDGAAEIEISELQGRLRTLSGEPASWRKLECSAPVPAGALGFVFTPQQGRGDQYLIREPRENGGNALIRIEDSGRGSQSYTFDLEWRDASALVAEGGFDGAGLAGGILDLPGGKRTNWNDEIDFRSEGDGFYRTFGGADALLTSGLIRVDRDGLVRMEFETNQRYRLRLSGRIVHARRNRLVAATSGSGVEGTAEILLDGRDRIREISMSGTGRSRFDLRWRPK